MEKPMKWDWLKKSVVILAKEITMLCLHRYKYFKIAESFTDILSTIHCNANNMVFIINSGKTTRLKLNARFF